MSQHELTDHGLPVRLHASLQHIGCLRRRIRYGALIALRRSLHLPLIACAAHWMCRSLHVQRREEIHLRVQLRLDGRQPLVHPEHGALARNGVARAVAEGGALCGLQFPRDGLRRAADGYALAPMLGPIEGGWEAAAAAPATPLRPDARGKVERG